MLYKCITATLSKDLQNQYFTEAALEDICKTSVGKPIFLNFGKCIYGKVISAKIIDLQCEITVDIFDDLPVSVLEIAKYIVPSGKVLEIKDNIINKIKVCSFSLTDIPADFTITSIQRI